MQKCISKEKLDCIHFTKENKNNVLKILEPNLECEDYVFIKEDENMGKVSIEFPGLYTANYFYNSWYVRDCYDYLHFTRYTESEFKEKFELV